MLDKLGSHEGAAVRRAIRHAGAHLLFLRPQDWQEQDAVISSARGAAMKGMVVQGACGTTASYRRCGPNVVAIHAPSGAKFFSH